MLHIHSDRDLRHCPPSPWVWELYVNAGLKTVQVSELPMLRDGSASARLRHPAQFNKGPGHAANHPFRSVLRQLADQLKVLDIFLFSMDDLSSSKPLSYGGMLCEQARVLARYSSGLQGGLAIDDVYAHPLIRRDDILFGHRMRAFIAATLEDSTRAPAGVLCASDQVSRRWTRADMTVLERIVAQFGPLYLSQI